MEYLLIFNFFLVMFDFDEYLSYKLQLGTI